MDTKQKQLTAEDIDAMAAGPELDALVAERVMGWRWLPYIEDIVLLWPPDGFPGAVLPSSPIDDLTELSDGRYLPWQMEWFSTNIAAAWQVLDTFDGYEVRHSKYYGSEDGSDPRTYWVELRRLEPFMAGESLADTPMLAICRAALKAALKATLTR